MYGDHGAVVTGEVIHHGQAVFSPPPRRRRARWPWVLSAVWVLALLCGGIPAVWLCVPIVRDTLRADDGGASPFVALLMWVNTFDDGEDGARIADRVVVASQRAKIGKVRRDWVEARRADLAAHPEVTGADGPQPGMPPETGYAPTGNRTNVLMYIEVTFRYRDHSAFYGTGSGGLPWRAEARKERDGWRLWSVAITPYCGRLGDPLSGYSKC